MARFDAVSGVKVPGLKTGRIVPGSELDPPPSWIFAGTTPAAVSAVGMAKKAHGIEFCCAKSGTQSGTTDLFVDPNG